MKTSLPNWKLIAKNPATDMFIATREEEIVLRDAAIQALYFYVPCMVFHGKMVAMIHVVETKHKDVSFMAIDVEQFSNQCKRFSIDSVPTLLVMKNGKEIKRISNTFSTEMFKSVLDDICSA